MRFVQRSRRGPACVQNCPAEALVLATDSTLVNLAKQRRQRAARLGHPGAAMAPCSAGKVAQMAATPPRGEPDKLSAEARKANFSEIYLPFSAGQANREAERCLTCGEHSICEWTCPLHNHIPQWIERVKEGIFPPPWSFLTRPTACRKLPAASARRIACAKGPARCAMSTVR